MMDNSQIVIYQTGDGKTKIDVRLDNGSVWLSQKLMAELFQTTPQNITIHLKKIYQEKELAESLTCKYCLQVQREGSKTVERMRKYAGTISHEIAIQKAEEEYIQYNKKIIAQNDMIDGDFEKAIKELPVRRKKKT